MDLLMAIYYKLVLYIERFPGRNIPDQKMFDYEKIECFYPGGRKLYRIFIVDSATLDVLFVNKNCRKFSETIYVEKESDFTRPYSTFEY